MLVVDDDPWILRMVTATLKKRDYVVDTAREGRQALQRANANPPDVIVSDVMMPVMDGWTFVEQLRQDPRLSGIPVIFLTALGRDDARIAQLGLSPDDFLAKPFRFDALEKRVAAALSKPQVAQSRPVAAAPVVAAPAASTEADEGYNPPTPFDAAAPISGNHAPTPPPVDQERLREPPKTSEFRAIGHDGRRARRTTALNGRLEQLQLSSLLVMMEMERKDGLLSLKDSQSGNVGRIFLRGGQVVGAALSESPLGGKESVYEMLRWKEGTFSFNAMEVEMDDSIGSSTTHLLMEGARLIDEAARDEGI